MEAIRFLIQLNEDTLLPSIEGLSVIELCNYCNWYTNSKKYEVYFGFIGRDRVYRSVNDAAKDYRMPLGAINYSNLIPVGSLEFTGYIKQQLVNLGISVINIPEELNNKTFTGRDCLRISKEELLKMKTECSQSEQYNWIVKPASKVKDFSVDTLLNLDVNDIHDDNVFISNKLEIKTEWRAFIYAGKIVGVRRYLGDADTPDIDFIEKCILAYKNSPKAYTLDIGKLYDGRSIVIEVHNFVSCGAYGLNEPKLLSMYKAGWEYELARGE